MTRWQLALALSCFTLIAPQKSLAEPISVISGEHAGFTRLVLEVPEDVSWQVSTALGKSTLVLDGFAGGFDLTQAFSIIPRTRLTALVARDSTLELQLACACPVESYLEQGRFLVLDIRDGRPLEVPLDNTTRFQEIPQSSFGAGDLLWSQSETPMNNSSQVVPNKNGGDESDNPEVSKQILETLAETQEQLLQAISDAASREIINFENEITARAETEKAEPVDAEVFDSSQSPIAPRENDGSHLRVTSSRDIPQTQLITDLSGATCPSPENVDFRNWSETTEFSTELAKSNANLYDQAGRMQSKEILSRARMYIYFGFGAEARQVLSLDQELVSKHPELVDLASILERGYARNPRYLHQFSSCDSDLALWSVLAAKEIPVDMVVNSEAALRGLQKLPTHLQYFFAQDLADRLVQTGDVTNARIAISIFENLEENFRETSLLVSAQLEPTKQISHDILTELSAQNHVQTPEAIAQLVDHHVEKNLPVPADLALLAEAFATELRDSDSSKEAIRAFILAAIKSSQFEKAYAALNNPPVSSISELKTELISRYFHEITSVSNDAEFLDSVFHQLPYEVDITEPIVLSKVATRLFELGFVSEVRRIVDLVPEDDVKQHFSLLNARLAIFDDNFEGAMNILGELDGEDAELLRGEVFQALRQPENAAQAYRKANNASLATSALWLSDEWTDHITADDPIFGPIQRVSSVEQPNIEVDDNMLANTQEQIEASEAARAVIETLLQNLAISD